MKPPLALAILLFLGLWSASAQTVVVKKIVNLRADPSVRHQPIQKLRPSTRLELLALRSREGFYHVMTIDGEEGWVWGRNIEILGSAGASPTDDGHEDTTKAAKKKVASSSSGSSGMGGGALAGGG